MADFPHEGLSCQVDADCYKGYEVCRVNSATLEGICHHKDLWPLTALEWIGVLVVSGWVFACNSSGFCSSGTLVVILQIFFHFSNRDSIALSNASIVCSAALRYSNSFYKPHPARFDTKGKLCGTLVDYNLTIVMLPMILLGATSGAIFAYILPEPLMASLFTVVLMKCFSQTAQRYYRLRRLELIDRRKLATAGRALVRTVRRDN